ncbi:MAG: lysophospholipid acyltransferase family protein [candidate division WOR-3 bacterium]
MRRSPVTWLLPLGTMVQFFLPRWAVLPVARFAGTVAFFLNHGQRKRVLENLRHVLGAGASEKTIARTARQTFVNLVIGYLDLMRGPVLKRRIVNWTEYRPGNLEAALKFGRGAILVTGHVGNWDLAAIFMTAYGYPLSAVVEPIPAGWTETFNRYRCLAEMEAIPIPERRKIADAIKRRRLLALVADRDLTGNGVVCPSFDSHRSFPRGPAAYALKYGLPVVVGCYVLQDRPGHRPYYGEVNPALEFQPTGDMARDIEDFTRLIARCLDDLVRRYPDQWFAFRAGWL